MREQEIIRLQHYNDRLYQLITSATQSYLLARSLSEKNENDYNLSINFIMFHEHLYIKNTIIDLHKILHDNKNESFNIHKYLKNIELNQRYFPNLTSSKLSFWKENIEKHSDISQKIISLRSKYYAHIDKNYLEYLQSASEDITFEDFEELFSDLQDFYIESNLILYQEITGFAVAVTVDYFNNVLAKHLK